MMCPGGKRKENTVHSFERDLFPRQELQHGGIPGHAHAIRPGLDAEVEIAQIPGHACGLFDGGHGNFQHFFGELFEDVINFSLDEKGRAVAQRLVDVEAKLLPVLRNSAPTPLGQSCAVRLKSDLMMSVKTVDVRQFLNESQLGHG